MTDTSSGMPMQRLRQAEWPPGDAAVWATACNPRPGPFSPTPRLSPATYRMYAEAYAAFLWHLKSQGLLDPAETPAERVTLERLDSYFARLKQADNADNTIVSRFAALRNALRLMCPGQDFRFITKPGRVSIRQMLPMHRRPRFVPDSVMPHCGPKPCSPRRSACPTRRSDSGQGMNPSPGRRTKGRSGPPCTCRDNPFTAIECAADLRAALHMQG